MGTTSEIDKFLLANILSFSKIKIEIATHLGSKISIFLIAKSFCCQFLIISLCFLNILVLAFKKLLWIRSKLHLTDET